MLDLPSANGEPAIPVAQMLPQAQVTCTDLSPRLAALAGSRAKRWGYGTAPWLPARFRQPTAAMTPPLCCCRHYDAAMTPPLCCCHNAASPPLP